MTSRSRTFLTLIGSLTLIAVAGCGTSGSEPVLYAEVRFQIRPVGASATPSVFRVDSLSAGGVSHPSIVGQEFTATDRFQIVLENAAPGYQGVFTLVSGADIEVTVSVNPSNGTTVSEFTAAGQETVVLTCVATASGAAGIHCAGQAVAVPPDTSAIPPGNPEVRFNVCSPLSPSLTCFAAGDSGFFGRFYTGTIGDSFISHLLDGYTINGVTVIGETTPSIYFVEGARDTANGVFQSVSNLLLQAELLVNGDQKEIASGTTDNVVLRTDL